MKKGLTILTILMMFITDCYEFEEEKCKFDLYQKGQKHSSFCTFCFVPSYESNQVRVKNTGLACRQMEE